MNHLSRIDELTPGACGLLFDETPSLLPAHVRPYIIATLLHRGAVRHCEIVSSLVSHCPSSDLKVGEWDPLDDDYCETTRLEKLIYDVLGDFVSEGVLRYNEEQDLWVLTGDNISVIISWAAATGAKLPQHLMLELSLKQLKRIPDCVRSDHAKD